MKNYAPQVSGGSTETEPMTVTETAPPQAVPSMPLSTHKDGSVAPSIQMDGEALTDVTTDTPKPDPVEENKKPQARLPAIMANENKYLEAKDLDSRYRLAQAFFRSGMVPKGYKDAASVFAGMELALELALKPFTALKNIAVINGSPSIWGDLPLALCRRSGKLIRIYEFIFDKDYKQICFANKNLSSEAYGAICRTWTDGATAPPDGFDYAETSFTMDDAKRAGLLGRENPWKTYPRRMLQMRARSQNLKDNFGDVLLGLDIAEYDHNFMPMKDVTPDGRVLRDGTVEKDVAAELNKTLVDKIQ